MKESWRWFGPPDKISLPEVAQTGASHIVTALHDIPYGETWPVAAIRERQAMITADASLGLKWSVVESLPVHDDIKRGGGDLDTLFANYRQSLANLAECGIQTVCYNFMPVVDWTRTDLDVPVPGGGRALGFSLGKMAGFELYVLGRDQAANDYSADACAQGKAWFDASSKHEQDTLLATIMAGLPGAYTRYDVEGLRTVLARWDGIGSDDLQAAYARFLAEIVPAADDVGVRLCVHPDDPPRPIFGLPRIVSTAADMAWILEQQESPANGLTFCAGAYGAHPDNNLARMFTTAAERVHFLHLRSVRKMADGSFIEDAHLAGDAQLVDLIRLVLAEEQRRKLAGRDDWDLPFRPDHGHELAGDIGRGTHPGYPLVGRLRSLAELRGVIAALNSTVLNQEV